MKVTQINPNSSIYLAFLISLCPTSKRAMAQQWRTPGLDIDIKKKLEYI